MRPTIVRHSIASLSLVLLLAGTIGCGPRVKQIGFYGFQDWVHAYCLTQTVLLAAAAVYGPGRLVVPLLCSWGLAIGFGLATLNLVSNEGEASLASGAILLFAGTLGPLIAFALYRWRTGAYLAFGSAVANRVAGRSSYQLNLQRLMILIAAFAIAGVVARRAITAPDPLVSEHDIHVMVVQIWLGHFLCLAAAPALLVVFRPSWKIVFAVAFFGGVTRAGRWLLGLADPYVFPDKFRTTYLEVATESFWWHCQAAVAVVIYALLARLAGFRMVVPDQSSDEKTAPSSQSAGNLADSAPVAREGQAAKPSRQ